MYSKIVNPKTGRKVSVGGKLGRQILRNYLIALNGGMPPSGVLRQKVTNALKKINPKFTKYVPLIEDLFRRNNNRFPTPGDTYGGIWQYDDLLNRLVTNGVDSKDAESMIKWLWTNELTTRTKFTPALLKQLELAGIKVPASMLSKTQS